MKGLCRIIVVLSAVLWIAWPLSVSMYSHAMPSQAPKMAASDAVQNGETWFRQRCSLCHLERILKNEKSDSIGPRLSGLFKDAAPSREADVREVIRKGSLRMPGFEYGLDLKQLDEIIAYLKTL